MNRNCAHLTDIHRLRASQPINYLSALMLTFFVMLFTSTSSLFATERPTQPTEITIRIESLSAFQLYPVTSKHEAFVLELPGSKMPSRDDIRIQTQAQMSHGLEETSGGPAIHFHFTHPQEYEIQRLKNGLKIQFRRDLLSALLNETSPTPIASARVATNRQKKSKQDMTQRPKSTHQSKFAQEQLLLAYKQSIRSTADESPTKVATEVKALAQVTTPPKTKPKPKIKPAELKKSEDENSALQVAETHVAEAQNTATRVPEPKSIQEAPQTKNAEDENLTLQIAETQVAEAQITATQVTKPKPTQEVPQVKKAEENLKLQVATIQVAEAKITATQVAEPNLPALRTVPTPEPGQEDTGILIADQLKREMAELQTQPDTDIVELPDLTPAKRPQRTRRRYVLPQRYTKPLSERSDNAFVQLLRVKKSSPNRSRLGLELSSIREYDLERITDTHIRLSLYDVEPTTIHVRKILDARRLDTTIKRVRPTYVTEEGTQAAVIDIEVQSGARLHVREQSGVLWLDAEL